MNSSLDSSSSNIDIFRYDYDEEFSETFVPPTWMIEFVEFRKRLFLAIVEPVIVTILGPVVVEDEMMMMPPEFDDIATTTGNINHSSYDYYNTTLTFDTNSTATERNSSNWMLVEDSTITSYARRRLSFLPSYVEDIDQYRETSMSFATLAMLFVLMSCMLLVFLSCFYHNQKTSPLFISPRRHRLPKLVPPPLPVDGYFSWVRI